MTDTPIDKDKLHFRLGIRPDGRGFYIDAINGSPAGKNGSGLWMTPAELATMCADLQRVLQLRDVVPSRPMERCFPPGEGDR